MLSKHQPSSPIIRRTRPPRLGGVRLRSQICISACHLSLLQSSSKCCSARSRCTHQRADRSTAFCRAAHIGLFEKCTLDKGPCKADARGCGDFRRASAMHGYSKPRSTEGRGFFRPRNRLVDSVCFAAAKLSQKANSRATATRWRQERPGPDKQRPKSQSAKLDLCPTPMPNLGPYAH